jgi:hypothetical protein
LLGIRLIRASVSCFTEPFPLQPEHKRARLCAAQTCKSVFLLPTGQVEIPQDEVFLPAKRAKRR